MSNRYKSGDVVKFKGFEIRRSSNNAFGRWMYRPEGGPIDEGIANSLAQAKSDIRAIVSCLR